MPSAVRLVLAVALALAALGWVLFLFTWHRTHAIDARGLFPASQTWVDLTIYINRFDVFRSPAFFQLAAPSLFRSRFAYPPAAALCYAFLYGTHHIKLVYILVTAISWLCLLGYATVLLRPARGSFKTALITAGVLCLLGYPAVFLFERANIEIFLWFTLFAGLLLYRSGRHHAAAFCFGLAAALKMYPILLLGLFLHRRKEWPAILTGVAAAILVTITCIWFTAPGFFMQGAHGYLEGISGFQASYASSTHLGPVSFDHSIFSWVKLAALGSGRAPEPYMLPYYAICGSAFALVFLLRVRHLPFLNQFTYLTLGTIMLPAVSFEYTLVHLYLPALLFAVSVRQTLTPRVSGPGWLALLCMLGALLPVDVFGALVDHAGQVQVLFLLGLLTAAASGPWLFPEASPKTNSTASPGSSLGEAAHAYASRT